MGRKAWKRKQDRKPPPLDRPANPVFWARVLEKEGLGMDAGKLKGNGITRARKRFF